MVTARDVAYAIVPCFDYLVDDCIDIVHEPKRWRAHEKLELCRV